MLLFNCTCFGEQEKLLEIAVPFSFPMHCLSREYEASVFAVKTSPLHSLLRLSLQRWCQKMLHFYPFSPLWQKTRNFAKGEKRFTACFWARQFGCGVYGAREKKIFLPKYMPIVANTQREKKIAGFFSRTSKGNFLFLPPL